MPIPGEESLTSKLSGVITLDGFFRTWVKKGSVIREEFSETFKRRRVVKNPNEGLDAFSMEMFAYDGEGDTDLARDESGNLLPNIRCVCSLKADLSGLQRFLKVRKTPDGHNFWQVDYGVKILFGGTALKARLTWYEGVSTSHFHPHVTDIWLYLSGNLPRRPCQHYSELNLLDHVCFPS